ncbi:dephospho-CoA kinase [Xenophilus azovorans]|uniref:dephospho-CoA kinase n=1 Tax=Xenophilus azovorans TaxID=151755 RepID=UPI00056EC4EC|nr:dephospho-CoA kinase [Xenophilus azovorans]
MRRIGLTGGIGSGKSTVSMLWRELGVTVVDTDAIARALTAAGGTALPAIAQAFGPTTLDAQGALDRARMREIVFADPAAKGRLEAILHPLIGQECERQAAAAAGPGVVFDVPLLVESGRWRRLVDRVVVVDASEATQLERVIARSGWQPEIVQAVIAQQADRRARRAAADAVLFNDGIPLEELRADVRTLHQRWLGEGLR